MLDIILRVIAALGIISLILVGLTVSRNEAVYKFRKNLLEQIMQACNADVYRNRDWGWRLAAFDSVSYHKMLWQQWRKLDSFYPDLSFIDPDAVNPNDSACNVERSVT